MKNTFSPAFDSETIIPIFFACNLNYLPIFAVALQSLVSNTSINYQYDIWLLISDCPDYNKEQLLKIIDNRQNISLRFLDFQSYIPQDTIDKLYISKYISIETYFRLFIPDVFNCYDKILWLDSDIIIKRDVAQLYQIEIGEQWVAMAPNVWAIYASEKGDITPGERDMTFKDYIHNYLGMSSPTHYSNCGVMILNTKQLRLNGFASKCIEALDKLKTPNYWDQDLINVVCEHHNVVLPLEWNHVWYIQDYQILKGVISNELYSEYEQARFTPAIIHYAGSIKPWINPDKWLADDFWYYARKTPFYSKIITDNTIQKLGFHPYDKGPFNVNWKLIYQITRYGKLKRLCFKYRVLSKFRFLKNRRKYLRYYHSLRDTIKHIDNLLYR